MKRNDLKDIGHDIFFQNYENLFNVYQRDNGEYFYNITRKLNIPAEIREAYYKDYVVKYGDSWTGIAFKMFNDVKLWWIICATNNIIDPLGFPEPGYILKILDKDIVRGILAMIRDN